MSVPACIANAIADALGVKDVRAAGDAAAPARADGGPGRTMKPRPFDYLRPDTVEEAVARSAEYGDDARVLAGGQSLVAMLNFRLIEPAVLIDIARLGALDSIRDRGGTIEIGAAVTQNRLLACRGWRRNCRSLPRRCRWSGISRRAIAARSAARSRMPIRARNFRWRWPCSEAKWCCARRAGSAPLAAAAFPARHADDGARAGRTDHRRALSGPRRNAASPSARWRGGTAISPSSRSRPRSKAESGAARRRRRGRRPRCVRIDGRRRSALRDVVECWPGSSRATKIFTRGRAMRRDILRRLAPDGHRGGATMRRVSKTERARIRLTLNGRKLCGGGRAALAAQRFPAPRAWRDRHACRLRARRLRLLHRADRRRRRAAPA